MPSSQTSTHQSENYVCCLIITVALSYIHISLDTVNRADGGVDGGDRPTHGKNWGKNQLFLSCVVVLIGPAPGVCPCLLNIIQQAVRYAP